MFGVFAIVPAGRAWFAFVLGLGLTQLTQAAVPPVPPAAIIEPLPNLPKGTAVGGRDDGLSIKIGPYCCFLFGDTMLTKSNSLGDFWVVNTLYHTMDTDGDDGVDGGFNFRTNGSPPLQFIPYTAAEQAYKEQHQTTDKFVPGIWPMGQFYSPYDRKQYVTFSKVIERPNQVWLEVGSGLAICPNDPVNDMATRVQSRPGNTEDYLMWDSNERDWGHMCAVLGDFVYFYYVEGQNYGALRVARAYLGDGPDAGATLDFLAKTNWQYWSGSGWATNNPAAAAVLFYSTGVGTIDWNPYLPDGEGGNGCYLYSYLSWVSTNICCRASADLVHWSPERILAGVPNIPAGSFPYFARAHKCLEKESGRILYISYCRPVVQLPLQDMPMLRAEFPRPTLSAQLAANTLILSWLARFGSGFVLEQNSDPVTSNWNTSEAAVSSVNGTNRVVLAASSGRQFYRLTLR